MRRIRLVLAVATVMVAMMAVSAAPASAQQVVFDNANGFFINPNAGFSFTPNNNAFFNTSGVSQGLAERSTTGNVTTNFTAQSTGDNSNQCVAPLQFGNTGAQQNTQGVLQFGSNTGGSFPFFDGFFPFGGTFGGGEIDLTGGTFEFSPTLSAPCTPQVEQSSAASSG